MDIIWLNNPKFFVLFPSTSCNLLHSAMIKRTFCSKVHVGNWMEDDFLDEEKQKRFLQKEQNGELLIQKLEDFIDLFYKEVELSVCPDGYVHFGDIVQIVHDGLHLQTMTCLSMNISSLKLIQKNEDLQYSMSTMKKYAPVTRNTFTIVSKNGKTVTNKPLHYGEEFMLCASVSNEEMFLHSNMVWLGNYSTQSQHQDVILSPKRSCYTIWKALPSNREYWMDLEDTPLMTNKQVVLNHVFTNQNLCLEEHQIKTLFGIENEVSVHTYPGRRQCVDRHNLWTFVTEAPCS